MRVVATNGNGYATATNYQLVITTGTVGGTSVVGYVVAEFSIEARSALMPTTAALTLDVSAGGEAGLDWGNIGSKTTTNALTNTSIITTQKVDVDTIKTNPVVNGGTITFPTTATLASTTNITAGTVTTATNLTNAPTSGDFTATMKTSIGTAVAASAVASVTGNVGGNVTGSVGSVVGAVGSVTGAVGSVTGAVGSVTARVTANADQLAGQTVSAAAGVTFPASVASPTNITAGTITTATNLTNAPTSGDFTATMKTSLNAATPAVTVSDKTGFSLSTSGNNAAADALLDRTDAIETGLTPRQAARLGAAADAGVLAGAATTSVTIKNAVANSKTRITATVDADGNRSAVSTDVT